MTISALLLHPRPGVGGNLLWVGELPPEQAPHLAAGVRAMETKGYWASAFPEGDGVTFQGEAGSAYDSAQALIDIRAAFPLLSIEEPRPDEGKSEALARLSGGHTVTCRYLAPVEGLRIDQDLDLGLTRLHRPVDGVDKSLSDHSWQDLCDVPGADVDPTWAPGPNDTGTTELLRHTLVERSIQVPVAMLHVSAASHDAQSPLLRLLMEDADRSLDAIRLDKCHYHLLHHLPNRPGWIHEFAVIWLMPQPNAFQDRLLVGKPYVLRVSNTWLGLDIDDGAGGAVPFADITDSDDEGEIALALKAALRAANRAFYLADLEASFLHLVYATDALCWPDLRGSHHRLWISAFASSGDPDRFEAQLKEFDRLYKARNKIVHEGKSLADVGIVGEEACQFMLDVLRACILTFILEGFVSRSEADRHAFDLLTSTALAPSVAAAGLKHVTVPLSADPVLLARMNVNAGFRQRTSGASPLTNYKRAPDLRFF